MLDSLAIEIISRLDTLEAASKVSSLSILYPIIGMFLVSLIGWIFAYIMHANNRKDKYKLAAVDKKIKALCAFIDLVEAIVYRIEHKLTPGSLEMLNMKSWNDLYQFIHPDYSKQLRDLVISTYDPARPENADDLFLKQSKPLLLLAKKELKKLH